MAKDKTKFADLAAKSVDELQAELKATREELFRQRFQLAIKQLENTGTIGELKNKISQISTALRQHELKAQA